MIESELKITLDARDLARLRRHPALAGLRLAPRRTETLVSVYYDTPDRALAAAGMSLRLRRAGRAWVQTVKRRAGADAAAGFFSHRESERPAPGGRLVLDAPDDDGALADVGGGRGRGAAVPGVRDPGEAGDRAAERRRAARSSWRSTRARSAPARRGRRSARRRSS